jgi:hypothetical protein
LGGIDYSKTHATPFILTYTYTYTYTDIKMPPTKRKAASDDLTAEDSSSSAPRAKRERAPNTKWEDADLDSLVVQLKEAKNEGKMGDNGLKNVVWGEVAASFPNPLKTERTCQTRFS